MTETKKRDPNADPVWLYIASYQRDYGFSPTLREISRACFLSVASVGRHLARLEREGRVETFPGQARSIRLIVAPPDAALYSVRPESDSEASHVQTPSSSPAAADPHAGRSSAGRSSHSTAIPASRRKPVGGSDG